MSARLGHLAVSETGFLLDTRTGNTYTLNETGTFIVKALSTSGDPGDLAEAISAEFEVDQETAARDLAEFLLQLRELGLIPKDDDPGSQA